MRAPTKQLLAHVRTAARLPKRAAEVTPSGHWARLLERVAHDQSYAEVTGFGHHTQDKPSQDKPVLVQNEKRPGGEGTLGVRGLLDGETMTPNHTKISQNEP